MPLWDWKSSDWTSRLTTIQLTVAEYFRDEEGQDGMFVTMGAMVGLVFVGIWLTLGFSASFHRQHLPFHPGWC